jgi:protein phosphatase
MAKLRAWCQTDVGLRRENNQDFYLIDDSLGLYVVADGMGGHRGGEIASRMATEKIHESVRKAIHESRHRKLNPRMLLVQGYEEAGRQVFEASGEPGGGLEGMGTTVVAALFHEGVLFIGNVGDSRAYIFTRGQRWQMTEDHSLVNEQLRAGLIAERDVAKFTGRNVITRSVGFEREVQVDLIERKVEDHDLFLICSDGLSSLVSDERIAEICRDASPEKIVGLCIEEAKKNGGDDNVTVMVLYMDRDP